MNTDYPIEALDILLDKDCLSERYYSLLEYKEELLTDLQDHGCRTKSDAEKLPDEFYLQIGMLDIKQISLFRRFLKMYDPKSAKFREIAAVTSDPVKQAAFHELYCLPGVKQIRAELYYLAGYKTLRDFAEAPVEEVLKKTAHVVKNENLSCIVPLPKEVRTQIAVAKAFTMTE